MTGSARVGRISRAEAERMSFEELYLALIAPLQFDRTNGSRGQQILATATFFIREVDNGGLAQAFYNWSLDELLAAIDAFEAVGATTHAEIVRLALSRLFEGVDPASDTEVHSRVDALTEAWVEENFDALDERLYDERQLWPYFQQFIEANPEEFFFPD
jgi:hypothetical protein